MAGSRTRLRNSEMSPLYKNIRVFGWAACLLTIACGAARLRAHETDQYSVPVGLQFADLGSYFSADFHARLIRGVNRANAAIEAAERAGNARGADAWRAPESVARAIHDAFPTFVTYIDDIERLVHSHGFRRDYPGLVTAYRPIEWLYSRCWTFDFRQFFKIWGSSTIMIEGVFLGTDKLGHFVHNGYFHYEEYRRVVRGGGSREQALAAALRLGAGDNLVLSERGALGYLTSGVFSNADLASNWAGMMFFINLTEDIPLDGLTRSPLLRLERGRWRLRDDVTPRSDFFTALVTGHYDEVLNPNLYSLGMNSGVREVILQRCGQLRHWYTDVNGAPLGRSGFEAAFDRQATFMGENYGREAPLDEMLSVINLCFDEANPVERSAPSTAPIREPEASATALASSRASRAHDLERGADRTTNLFTAIVSAEPLISLIESGATVDMRDALGRTPLRYAVRAGETKAVAILLDAGANPNSADVDGETPLHDAVRFRRVELVRLLLNRGADPNAASRSGATPLHVAVRFGAARETALLLESGADPNARDRFGCNPLHDAAELGDLGIARSLVKARADITTRNQTGHSPFALAKRARHQDLARWLKSLEDRRTGDDAP